MHPLRAYREASGLSQEALGERVGVTKASLSRIESGDQKPSIGLAQRIEKETGGAVPRWLLLPEVWEAPAEAGAA